MNARFPMGSAEEIFQDREGYLWIGTVNGLVRFDGYSTCAYMHDPDDPNSLAANNINGISQDSMGRIWIGMSAHGLDVLDAEFKSFTHVCLPDSTGACFTDISINDFASADGNSMWVGGEHGLFRVKADNGFQALDHYKHVESDESSITNTYVLETYVDRRGRLWVGTLEGINLFDQDKGSFINYHQNPTYPKTQILDIMEDREGGLWVSVRFTRERLVRFDEYDGNFYPDTTFVGRHLGDFRLTFSPDNDLWISSRGMGAFHLDAQSGQVDFYDPGQVELHGYRNDYGLQPLCDRNGNIWIIGEQVLKLPATGKDFRQIDSNEEPILSIFSRDSLVWYTSGKPFIFNKNTGQTSTYWPSEIPTILPRWGVRSRASQRIYCTKEYDSDHVVLTTVRNVFIWNIHTNTFKEFPLDRGGPFREFVFGKTKDEIWICSNQGRLIHLDLKTGTDLNFASVEQIQDIRCAAKDTNNTIWFGSGNLGVFRYDMESEAIVNFVPGHENPDRRLSDYYVNDIHVNGSDVWVATNLGLNKIDAKTNTVTQIRKQDVFINENVLSILSDKEGHLWLATQEGLVQFDPANHRFWHYDQSDGLINASFAQGAAFRDNSGWLYFGGDQGIDYFDPSQIGMNSMPPDLYLSRVLVNNQPIDTNTFDSHLSSVSLAHTENFIEIEMLALHLTAPEGNRYAYKITELDSEWRNLGTRRSVTLANLRPGRYTLEAKASNSDGVWCEPKTLLAIAISPPFWATWWFITGVSLVILALIAVAYRYRIHQIQTRERLKTEFNKRIAELESKALRAQMNPHFLFNSINSVKSLISQGENDKATQYLTRFGQLIRQVLANSEQPLVRLQEELEALRLYLNIEQLRFQNFDYSIEVDSNVNVDFIEVPPLILQPYVENAIWHGLMHKTSGERKVQIKVRLDGDFLDMSVEDNGIGREKAGQMKMLGNTRKGGMGMRLTGDRLELLRTAYGQDVSVRVHDLHVNGKASGTRVEITIPYIE